MRIAFLADPLDVQSAGIHRYAKEMLSAIDALGSSHDIFIQRAVSSDDYINCKEIIIPINPSIPLHQRWRTFSAIPKALNKLNLDAVIELAHFGPFGLEKDVKRLTMIHDLTPILFPQFHPAKSVFFHKLLLNKVLKDADHIITNSENSKKDIIKKYPFCKSKVDSIPLGVDTNISFEEDATVFEKHKINKPYFLHVGTIEPRKNLSRLLHAYNEFRQEGSKVVDLVLVGKKGWKCESIYNLIEKSPYREDIKITGFLNERELYTLYSRAQAFIYPSHYEGFGLPILEAMKYGSVVLSARNSSLPEVGADVAIYFENKAELKNLMTEVLIMRPDERDTLSERGKSRAREFSWNKTAESTLALIEKVVENTKYA